MGFTGSPYTRDDFIRDTGASASQAHELTIYRDLIAHWSGQMNLVGPTALADFWSRHALDSAQLLHVKQANIWVDVGAGAGFPGVILAILMKGDPRRRVHLIESMAKRVRFLQTVVHDLALPVTVHHARAECLKPPFGVEIVTARACAPFPRLFTYTAAFFDAGAEGLFLKGRDVESELTEARLQWTFHADLIPSRSDPSGRIAHIRGLVPRG